MKTVILYLQDKKVIYQIKGKGVEEGEFDIGEAEAFLEKNRPDILNIILAKPHLIFRRIEFPFRNKKKIQMVIPSEIEETLPESPDNFVFSFDFIHTDKNKTVVNVYAIPSTIFNFWDKEAKKYRARIFFFSDTLLFHQFLKQHTNEKNHIGIYEDSGYLLLNITEDGVLTGSYSYFIEQSTLAESMALVNEILSNKNIPVFICAEQNIKQGLSIEKERVRYIDLPVGMNRKYLFHYLSSFKMFRRMFSSIKDTREKKFPVVTSILVLIFLIFSVISFAPYIKITERQKKLEGIDNEMKQIFLSTFPDVHNVVNPLLQAREKIQRNEGVDIKAGVPSVLRIMADITLLFPENIDARIDVFRIVGDTITISGTMDSLKTLEIVKKRIEQSERFVITGMGTISFDERNRLNFTMTLKIV